jgi:hypothetical protein
LNFAVLKYKLFKISDSPCKRFKKLHVPDISDNPEILIKSTYAKVFLQENFCFISCRKSVKRHVMIECPVLPFYMISHNLWVRAGKKAQ